MNRRVLTLLLCATATHAAWAQDRLALAVVSSFLPLLAVAQQAPPDARPNRIDKALITKTTPTPKGKASPNNSKPVKQYTIEQFMNTTRVGGSAFTADEQSILFHSNKSGIFNVYSVPVAGGEPKQLTNSARESTYLVSTFPADARFLYRHDVGGNENEHLYLRKVDGSERDLTPGEKTKANFLGWSQDRKSFFFSTNERDPKFFDIFEMTIADLNPRLIYQDETGFNFADISNDKRFIAFGKPGETTADADVYLYNTETREMKNITAHEGEVDNAPQVFDVGSKYLYFLSDDGAEFKYIARYELGTGKREKVENRPGMSPRSTSRAKGSIASWPRMKTRAPESKLRKKPRASRSNCRRCRTATSPVWISPKAKSVWGFTTTARARPRISSFTISPRRSGIA